jgi:hypothetical protein
MALFNERAGAIPRGRRGQRAFGGFGNQVEVSATNIRRDGAGLNSHASTQKNVAQIAAEDRAAREA